MFGSSAASRRVFRLRRVLIGLQIALLVFSMAAPIGTMAADPPPAPIEDPGAQPSSDPAPTPSADPTAIPDPSPDPTATPDPTTATEPTPAPTVDPTVAPTLDPTPDPTTAPPAAVAPYIVSFVAGTSAAAQADALAAAGATDLDSIAVLRMHAVQASDAAAAALRADASVASVELDRSRAAEATPDDTSYGDQWSLTQIGWDLAYGSTAPAGSSIVAVLDTGVDASHPDIDDSLVGGASFVMGSAWNTDPNGHGTAMAGIVAAETNNGAGIAGVGFAGVRVMPVTVLNSAGLGRDSDIIEGLVWAADHGADVALLAFSASGYSSALQAAVDYAWSKGVVIVAATGNDGSSTATFPAGDRGVVGVSNTDQSDTLNASSNDGADTFLAAPGTEILTLVPGGGTTSVTGTSASAAEVAGAAALLHAVDPSLSAGAVVGRLARSADAAGTVEQTGNGRLNLARALADTGTAEVKPAGAAPVGAGGPFVGPYVAAARNWVLTFAGSGTGTVEITPSTGTIDAPVACGGTGSAATSQTVSSTCGSNITTSVNGATITFLATATGGSTFGGWSSIANASSNTCVGTADPCSLVFGGNGAITVTFNVVVNTAPTAANKTPSTSEDTAVAITLTATDPNQCELTFSIVAGPANGSLGAITNAACVAGSPNSDSATVTYTPTANFNGADSFTYQAFDGSIFSTSATVSITINAVNDAPSFVKGGNQTVNEDAGAQSVSAWATSISAGPANESGQAVNFIVSNDNNGLFGGQPAVSPTGTLTYTPAANANGSATVSVQIHDNGGVALGGVDISAVQTFTISVNSVNDAPSGANKTITINEDAVYTFTAADFGLTDPSDSPANALQAVKITTLATAGTLKLSGVNVTTGQVIPAGSIGNLTLTPVPDANGSPYASFTFQVQDNGGTALGGVDLDPSANTITFNVTAVNDAPVVTLSAGNDLSANEGTSHTYGFTVSDVDAGATFTVVSVSCGANGSQVGTTTTTASGGSFVCLFPDGPASSIVSIQVKDDANANSNTATQTVSVLNVAPTVTLSAGNDLTADEGSQHTYGFTVSDPGADTFTVVSVDCGANGSQVGSTTSTVSGGSFVCSFPDGPASSIVSVQVSDSDGASSNTDTQTVSVLNVRPSIVLTGPASADEGSTRTYSLTVTDPGQDTHTITTACGVNGTKVALSDTYNAGTGLGSFQCFFADGSATTNVTATVTDSDGASDTDNQVVVVTVDNVAPVVTLSATNDLSVNEGSQHTYSFSVSDAGADTFSVVSVDCGANGSQVGSTTTTASGGSFDCSFPDGPASSTVSVQVKDSDNALSNTDTQTVTIANVKPTVVLSGTNSANEGTTHTYTYTVTDPGTDTFTIVESCGANGDLTDTLTANSFDCTFPDGPASSTVSVSANDEDPGDPSDDSIVVAVANVAPTVTLTATNDLSVDEGSQHTYSFTVGDAGTDTFTVVSVSCGTGGSQVGTTTTTVSGGSFDCSFPDGPVSSTVSVQVKDSDNANSNTDTQTVSVLNVAPTVTLTGSATANEGNQLTYSFTTADPGVDTFVLDGTDCGLNGAQVGLATFNTATGAGSFLCAFPDGPASSTVSVTVSDSDGASDGDSLTISVANVKPSISLTGDATADEGSTHTYSFNVTDPGQDTHTITTACGVNGTKVALSDTYNAGTGLGNFQCFFADGPATTNVTATVTDSDGASDTDNQVVTVTVDNVAPVVTLSATNDLSVNEGSQHTYSFTTTDPGEDDFALLSTDCGLNGTQVGLATFDTTTGAGSFVCHFADGPASSIVSVQVEDSDGADSNTATQTVTVNNVAPTVTLLGVNSADEGQAKSYTFTTSDPGVDTFTLGSESCGGAGVLSNAAFTAATGAGSFDCTFPDGPDSSVVSVQVKDSDNADSNVSSITVTVDNVAPVVTLSATNDLSVNEGSQHTYSFSVSDAGADTFSVVSVDCGANGSQVGSTTTTASGGSFDCSFPDGPASSTVSVQVKDSDNALSNTDTQTVTIANVKPTVVLSGTNSANEGTTHTYTYTVTDPGTDTFTIVESCGANGDLTDTLTANSFDCTFPDGPASSTVSVSANDEDPGPATVDSIVVAVANVKPNISLTGDATADEGSTHVYSYTVTDPGVDTHTITTACGANGAKILGSDTFVQATGLGSFQCFFADGPATTNVTATVIDSDGASDTDNQVVVVTVDNVKPTVVLSGANSANEGTTHTYTYTVSDPGDDTLTIAESCGANGDLTDTLAANSFDCTFPDGPANSTVSVSANDEDPGPATVDSIVVAIANVAPTVTLTGSATANEGETKTYSFTVIDPGADTFSVTAGFPDCGTGGTLVAGSLNTTASGGTFNCIFPDGPASPTVRIQVTDSDTADSNISAVAVTVSNVAPTVTLSAANDLSVDEGSQHTYSFTVSDPGADTFTMTVADCGANGSQVGTTTTTVSGGSFVCTFPDGPASSIVSVQVSDSDGANSNTATQTVTVDNVAPTAALSSGNDLSVNEGTQHSYSFTVTDPGVDTFTVVAVSCGANGSQVGSTTTTVSGGSFTCTFPDGPASSIVSVQVSDSDGANSNTATQTVTVNNVAPTVTLSAANDLSVNEGTQHTYAFSVSDPGVDTFSVAAVSCGLYGSQVGTTTTTASGGSFVCTFPDGPKSSTVSVQVKDSDNANSNSATQIVTIANINPTVGTIAFTYNPVTGVVGATAPFTDPGTADTHTAAYAWTVTPATGFTTTGPTVTEAAGNGFATGSIDLPPGCWTVSLTVTITDKDGGVGTRTQSLGSSADAYATQFQAPIKDNERNLSKAGNVVPIKVSVTSQCTGAAVPSLSLYVAVFAGNIGEVVDGTSVVTESVSNADTGQLMRPNGSGYMYNLSTKSFTTGQDYTVQIRSGSATGPVVVSALIRTQK